MIEHNDHAQRPSLLVAGMCPILVLSLTVYQALMYSLLFLAVLGISHGILYAARSVIPLHQRGAYTMLASGAVTSLAWLLSQVLAPDTVAVMGIFFPLLAIQASMTDSHRVFRTSCTAGDLMVHILSNVFFIGAFMLGFAFIREFLGNGTLTILDIRLGSPRVELPFLSASPVRIMLEASAGFVLLGLVLSLFPETKTGEDD